MTSRIRDNASIFCRWARGRNERRSVCLFLQSLACKEELSLLGQSMYDPRESTGLVRSPLNWSLCVLDRPRAPNTLEEALVAATSCNAVNEVPEVMLKQRCLQCCLCGAWLTLAQHARRSKCRMTTLVQTHKTLASSVDPGHEIEAPTLSGVAELTAGANCVSISPGFYPGECVPRLLTTIVCYWHEPLLLYYVSGISVYMCYRFTTVPFYE